MDKRYLISYEPFYYGNRLKATIETIEDRTNYSRMYIGRLYTHGKKLVGQKTFFKIGANFVEQNELYKKCADYVLDYLYNKCVY